MTNVVCVFGAEQQHTVSALGLQSVTVECLQLVQLYVTDLGICVKHLMPTNLNAVFFFGMQQKSAIIQ